MNIHFDGLRWDMLGYISEVEAEKWKNVSVQEGDLLLNITSAFLRRVRTLPGEMAGPQVAEPSRAAPAVAGCWCPAGKGFTAVMMTAGQHRRDARVPRSAAERDMNFQSQHPILPGTGPRKDKCPGVRLPLPRIDWLCRTQAPGDSDYSGHKRARSN